MKYKNFKILIHIVSDTSQTRSSVSVIGDNPTSQNPSYDLKKVIDFKKTKNNTMTVYADSALTRTMMARYGPGHVRDL